jgi:hypothetical protein
MYVQMDHKLYDDPALFRCSERLQVNHKEMLGMISLLWKFAMIHRIEGNLSDLSDKEIARSACFDSTEPENFVAALIENGFLTTEKKIPNWYEHSGQIFAERRRVKEYRDKKKKEEVESKAKT